MQFFILFVLLTAAWALDCNETPELCSPPGNHFHRNVRDGFCHSRKVSENWQIRPLRDSNSALSHTTGTFFGANNILLVGGRQNFSTTVSGRTLAINVDQLTTVSLATLPARYGHSAVVFASQLRVFGGVDAAGVYRSEHFALTLGQDNEVLDVKSSASWIEQKPSLILKRAFHTASLWGQKAIIFGGSDGTSLFNTVHSMNLVTNEITQIAVDAINIPSARYLHSAAVVANTLCVYGGSTNLQTDPMSLLPATLARADLWALDLLTSTWRTLIESLTMADTRVGARMTYLPYCNSLIVVGGRNVLGVAQKSVTAINLGKSILTPTIVSSGTAMRVSKINALAVASGSRVYIIGGADINDAGNPVVEIGGGELWEWM